MDWLLEAAPQRKRPESARNFRKRVDWCWRLEPRIEPDGVVHRVVMADGTYVNGWCLLTAIDGEDGEVLALRMVRKGEHSRLQGAVRAVGPSRRARMRRHERHSQVARANLAAHAGPTMSGARNATQGPI